MGQGRQQTERITIKQAGSERQAANDQEKKSTVQVVHGKTNWENRSEMLAGGNKTSQWVSVCVLLICECVNEVQVWGGNQD